MGARCTQSPISALYGVPRAFMRNHVQVGPSDTQSEMVAVGQAWGGRGGIMCGDTGRRLCGHLQTSAAQRDWAQACQQMWKWLSCCVCSYTFPAGCRTCSSSMVMTWTHYPPRGGGGGVFGRNRGSHPKWRNHHKSKSSISNVSTSPNMSPRHITLQMLPQSGMCRLR